MILIHKRIINTKQAAQAYDDVFVLSMAYVYIRPAGMFAGALTVLGCWHINYSLKSLTNERAVVY